MASNSSREAALERRKALTNGGKKAAGRFSSSPGRVRTASDSRPSRTTTPAPSEVMLASAPAASDPSRRPAGRPGRSAAPSAATRAERFAGSTAAASSPAASDPSRRAAGRPVSNPSRELVLARREALSKRGKRADTTRDRTRTDLGRIPSRGSGTSVEAAPAADHKCKCQEREAAPAAISSNDRPSLSASLASRSGAGNGSGRTPRRAAQHNPSRALVLARREALSKRGKSANTPSSSTAATVARQSSPDLSTRELAQKVRELKSKVGSAGSSRSGGTRPSGPNRHGAKQSASADAHWKVGASETLSGQIVTGTQANRSEKTTGNEAATCRTITGTEYLGAEVFQTFCGSQPSAPIQPAKVRVSATSHGNRVTGNEVGRSEKVTGDEPGTCKNVTGTEYISANQSAAYCGGVNPSVRKVGRSQTVGGQPVSGVLVGRSEKVTGDEPGSGRQLTGDQYIGAEAPAPGRAPTKVVSLQTLRGTGITGTHVGRSQQVTGDEPGSCRNITGDEYIGSQQYDAFCGGRPAPEAPKVGFSVTNRSQVVSGTRTGRSEKVTGDEPGTCKVVTGTPYAGLEESGNWCSSQQVQSIRQRTPVRMGTVMSGIQPGIGGVMTGAERGACEDITGTPYVGPDQLQEACAAAAISDADFPQPLDDQPWQRFSIQSPARAAQVSRDRRGGVTGSSTEVGGGRVTGPFAMAGDKITGTEHFRFNQGPRPLSRGPIQAAPSAPVSVDEDARPASRVTGEGISAGLKITGDDWDRGERVTGTEGVSARNRNPSRAGTVMPMRSHDYKRNQDIPVPESRITGSSGNTAAGSLITVSGGARG
ncbi:CsoS2 family carboxysome shell protein [Synechococcus sp. CBW1004]|uniref:carboxysome assembly protein CsoS2 n=1 Tax=Synechococcus sp. CBW1004 TaxID=1353136 RepID=UPI0018CD214A|nr:CsoS2 family carboxysome shell protein [Synechococcus sp. CBW1004]QPN63349.1 CsoS2 family carboxysome shell protein [Synechococcus sp. CBW1004]